MYSSVTSQAAISAGNIFGRYIRLRHPARCTLQFTLHAGFYPLNAAELNARCQSRCTLQCTLPLYFKLHPLVHTVCCSTHCTLQYTLHTVVHTAHCSTHYTMQYTLHAVVHTTRWVTPTAQASLPHTHADLVLSSQNTKYRAVKCMLSSHRTINSKCYQKLQQFF